MKRLLEQLDSIKAIVDTVSPSQLAQNPEAVASGYELYAATYDPIDRVEELRSRLIAEICKGKPVNGYLSAGFGYGKTATLVYLWHSCQRKEIVAVPPFKFKEVGDLMHASYSWIKYSLRSQPEIIPQVEKLYRKYGLKSQQTKASEIAGKYKVSAEKVLKIVQDLKTDTTNTDSVLNFWQESVAILQSVGFAGLAIFADESQEFLRTEEGSSARIQILSDLVKGMRALGNTPVALILSMPCDPTEGAIEEQAGDIIHRMKEQKVSLRLADAYNYEFPGKLWDFLCKKFLDHVEGDQLAHPATIESLGQLCDRKDLCNGPRAVVEVFKRLVHFSQDNQRPYTPLDLIQDYLTGLVQLYGTGQHRISNTINNLEQLINSDLHPRGREAIKLLAIFPAGVSSTVAQEFGLLESLQKLAEDGNLYGQHITQPRSDCFALVSLSENQTALSPLDEILNRFRQRWFGDWDNVQKAMKATQIFRDDILPLLLPPSRSGQKANWTWRYKDFRQERFGFYNMLNGAPERYNAKFPNRTLVISISSQGTELMRFKPPEETHLDWRFYLSYDRTATTAPQSLAAIAGTGQIDFHLQLGRSFEREYPTAFGLLRKVMAPEQCSACTLLNLSEYIQDWLNKHPEVSRADLARLEQHRRECHQYALQLLFPAINSATWVIQGLESLTGAETKFIESVFYQKCLALFPHYESFYNSIGPTLRKYKVALGKVMLAVRRGRQLHQVPKEDFEKLFETSGSSLPSFLSTLKQYGLISDAKIAGRKEENSMTKFTKHSLESLIQEQLSNKGRPQTVDTWHGRQDIKGLNYLELWEEVKHAGYLQEEFEEAIEWLELRRYLEWERQRGIIRTSFGELDADDLNGQLTDLRNQITELFTAFDETVLQLVFQRIDEAQIILDTNRDDEVALDQVQRTIQASLERIEGFSSGTRSAIQKDLQRMKMELDDFTKELNISKVSQQILNNSGLEPCLNDHRKTLERQINQLDIDCKKLSSSIRANETNLLALHRQIEQCNQSLINYAITKKRLQSLVAGLEQWRIIVNRAGALRTNINNDSHRLSRYEDDFVDRVVTHFSSHKIDSFKQYDLLRAPLEQIEQEINSERRARREQFERLLSRYEDLLGRIAYSERHLRDRCRFDDEDREGSYVTLRQFFIEKLEKYCANKGLEWEELESKLSFLAQERERDVTNLLNDLSGLKTELASQRSQLPVAIENLENLELRLSELKCLFDKGQALRGELRKLQFDKDENLKDEERELLNTISQGESVITLSQIRQHPSENQDTWKILKALYKKGYLEITLRRRD